MSTGIASKAVDLDSIFDPYVQGTSPGLTGIRRAGADINTRYAPLVYGIQAAATGILCKVGGAGSFVDLNTLFAAKGSAQYNLPINGQTFVSGAAGTLNHGSTASLTFTANTDGTYTVQAMQNNNGTPVYTTKATGTWNTSGKSASLIQALYTTSVGPDGTNPQLGGFTQNDAPSWTNVSSALGATDQVSVSATSGTKGNIGTLRIQFKDTTSGLIFSDSTIYFQVDADGST